ncbi:MAG: AAA family ATPase [Nitrospirae bacterium]|nr:AAA family ATPase [Nitrospirota bacterium]
MGGLRVFVGPRLIPEEAWPREKAKTLLKLLALAQAHALQREQVLEALWPDLSPRAAANNFYRVLHLLRRVLEPEIVVGGASRYLQMKRGRVLLCPGGTCWTDVETFTDALTAARGAEELAIWEKALDLYTGDLLEEDRYEEWVAPRREVLRREYLDALRSTAQLAERLKCPEQALRYYLRFLQSDPAEESIHRELMRLYAVTGQRHVAIRQYQACCRALQRELDAEPETITRVLYQEIISGKRSPRLPDDQGAFPHALPTLLRALAESSFVGRGEELAALDRFLNQVAQGTGGAMVIAGEVGVGKTRLAAESAVRLVRRGGVVLYGAAYEGEGHAPFGPLADAILEYCVRCAPDRLAGELVEWGAEMSLLFPAIRAYLPAYGETSRPDPQRDQQRAFTALHRWLAARAQSAAGGPLLFILDDLHAADPASLKLLHFLLRHTTPHAPVGIVAIAREEGLDPHHPLGAFLAEIPRALAPLRITVRRLPADAIRELATTHLGGQPVGREVVEHLSRTTWGNPLFIRAVLEDLKEHGELELAEGAWRIPASMTPRVPRGVQEVLNRRIDRLGETGKAFLALAAVYGLEFSYPQVLCAWGGREGDLLDAFDQTLASRLIEETQEGYRFAHPLIRETAYQDLSRPRRAVFHREAAKALETLAGPQPSPEADEILAYHWERSDIPARAVPFLIRSGDRAAAVYANADALDRYGRVLTLLEVKKQPEAGSLCAQVWEKMADTAALMGDAARSREAFGRALEHVLPEDAGGLVRIRAKAAFQALQAGDGEAARAHLEAGAAIGGADPALRETVEWANFLYVRGHEAWSRQATGDALQAAEESHRLAERLGATDAMARAYELLALVFHTQGEWKRGLQYAIKLVGSGEWDARVPQSFDVHLCLAEYHLYGDMDFSRVRTFAVETLAVAEKMGARRAMALCHCLLGEVALLVGDYREAEDRLRQSVTLYQEVGYHSGEALAWQRIGELELNRGNDARAVECLERGLGMAERAPMAAHLMGRLYAMLARSALERQKVPAACGYIEAGLAAQERFGVCATCNVLFYPMAVEVLSHAGQPLEAEPFLEKMQKVVASWGEGTWHAMSRCAQGSHALALGRVDEALEHFAKARDTFQRVGQPYETAKAHCFLARAFLKRNQDGDTLLCAHSLREAQGLFARLGALRDVGMAERLLKQLPFA